VVCWSFSAYRQIAGSPAGPPVTPDGRYIVVRQRLWRRTNPELTDGQRESGVVRLMEARRAVKAALTNGDDEALMRARRQVDEAKRVLGERGPVWWTDGSPDLNRRLIKNTLYAAWWSAQADGVT